MTDELYIESGIIESYTLGLANAQERAEFERRYPQSPMIQAALKAFEQTLEDWAFHTEKAPPPRVREHVLRTLKEAQKPAPPDSEVAKSGTPGNIPEKKFRNPALLKQVFDDPGIIEGLHWRQFEELATDLTTQLGFTAKLTRATRDGGKDIIVFHHTVFGDLVYYIECKHRTNDRKVGEREVRELYGTVAKDKATVGILFTNTGFTSGAIRFAAEVANRIKLVDRQKLLEIIDHLKNHYKYC